MPKSITEGFILSDNFVSVPPKTLNVLKTRIYRSPAKVPLKIFWFKKFYSCQSVSQAYGCWIYRQYEILKHPPFKFAPYFPELRYEPKSILHALLL
jgi:hypothetical protein